MIVQNKIETDRAVYKANENNYHDRDEPLSTVHYNAQEFLINNV